MSTFLGKITATFDIAGRGLMVATDIPNREGVLATQGQEELAIEIRQDGEEATRTRIIRIPFPDPAVERPFGFLLGADTGAQMAPQGAEVWLVTEV